MSGTTDHDENMQTKTDEYYEQLASQEQTYLDEVESRLIEGLISVETSS